MPLHLLGKKSWNVYSKQNIERVRRDEAAAAAREEEVERRMQDHDAQRRIAILRGQEPPSPLLESRPDSPVSRPRGDREDSGSSRRKRRRVGEDDTDRDIRLARQDASDNASAAQRASLQESKKSDDAPLYDREGHINLFPVDARSVRRAERNAEAEADKRRKERDFEDQYTMRFSNAAGKDGLDKPWYAGRGSHALTSGNDAANDFTVESKDVWGRADARRPEREHRRTMASDPLASLKRAQRQLRQSEVDRKRWKNERDKEVPQLGVSDEPDRRRKRLHTAEDIESLDLNAPNPGEDGHPGAQRNHADHRRSGHGSVRSGRSHWHQ